MKKIALFSILICLFFIQGCVRGQWINTKFSPINPTSGGYIKNYTLGEKRTAFIGQEIIKVQKCDFFQKTFISLQDISAAAKYRASNLSIVHSKDNHQYIIHGTVIFNDKTHYVTRGSDGSYTWGILVLDDGSIINNVLYSYDYEMLYLSDSIIITPSKLNYSHSCVRGTPSAISCELIFAGKNNVSLNTTYKEYSYNDLARPAFFQNLTYQANAQQIRFKDFLIQIHDVTNEQITYTVLEDGLK
ncbi:MAG TPA: hypothetical protein PKW92_06735 [Smithella sp.]|jgi:hypothetical protein|nr:hypothetical protein [Smithella sp.]HOX98471.1 hypothetical protein [Smithella sp.]HPN85799.1 hypothetical protein [Smithella sp.]HPX30760.1 hypothetical protein [Smithella sp.]HQC19213.1 hypothetical protein [Smithella sp.]